MAKEQMVVGHATKIFFDIGRERPLITEIWYPGVSDQAFKPHADTYARGQTIQNAAFKPSLTPYPLILFSHSSSGSRIETAWLLEKLAENGYVVAAVDHFGDTWHSHIPELARQTWDRPIDLLYVLEGLSSDPLYGPKIRQDKIGMVGYEKGALTGLWLAGGRANQWSTYYSSQKKQDNSFDLNDSLSAKRLFKDGRFRALALLAPIDVQVFDRTGLAGIIIPVLILTGQADNKAPFSENALYLANRVNFAKTILLKGNVGHDAFKARPASSPECAKEESDFRKKVIRALVDFFDREIK